MNRREFLEHTRGNTLTIAAGFAALHGVGVTQASPPVEEGNGAGKVVYRSLVGYPEGATKLHIHLTELDTRGPVAKGQHTHKADEAVYILEGQAEFTFAGKTHRVGPGDVVFFPSNVLHTERKYLTDHLKYLVIRSVEPEDEPCCCGMDRAAAEH